MVLGHDVRWAWLGRETEAPPLLNGHGTGQQSLRECRDRSDPGQGLASDRNVAARAAGLQIHSVSSQGEGVARAFASFASLLFFQENVIIQRHGGDGAGPCWPSGCLLSCPSCHLRRMGPQLGRLRLSKVMKCKWHLGACLWPRSFGNITDCNLLRASHLPRSCRQALQRGVPVPASPLA